MTATLDHTILLKADTRIAETVAGGRIYTATAANHIVIRDIYISRGAAVDLVFPEYGEAIVLPVVGGAILHQNDGKKYQLSPGDVLGFDSSNGRLAAQNPFPEETINFLHITFIGQNAADRSPSVSTIDIAAKNRLISGNGFAKNIQLGVYDSRMDDISQVAIDRHLLAYVINGSFEVEGRLMEHRDGLVLWGSEQIEFEALSEAAIILLIEFSTKQ